jgi:hypothetical protein
MKTFARIIQYIFLQLASYSLALFAMIFCWAIALFVNKETGYLPKWLNWFQTADASCYDVQWVAEHPTWSKYKIAMTWIARNAAWGFRKSAGITNIKPITVQRGNIYIADGEHGVAGSFFLQNDDGYFNYSYVIDLDNGNCMRGEMGWYLLPMAKHDQSINTGMLQTDPIRFYAFGRKGN